jgi:hypothetical protein
MLTILKDENVKDKTFVAIIKKLTFSTGGEFMFDRVTGKFCFYSWTFSVVVVMSGFFYTVFHFLKSI